MESELESLRNNQDPQGRIGRIGTFATEVNSKELLECLSSRAGSKLERLLSDLGCDWVGQGGSHGFDRDLHTVKILLFRISASGFTRLVNKELSDSSYWSRRQAYYEWAHIRPNEETLGLLRKNSVIDSDGDDLNEQLAATVALARIGDWDSVIASILQWGCRVLENEIYKIRYGQEGFSDRQLDATLNIISGKTEKLPNALLVLSISNRKDLAPKVIDELENCEKDSDVPLSALVALSKTGGDLNDHIELIAKYLTLPELQRHAANTLFRIGSKEALDQIQEYLESLSTIEQCQPKMVDILCALLNHAPDRTALHKISWAILQRFPSNLVYHELVRASCRVNNSEFQSFLWEQAFSSPSGMRIVGMESSAVRHLGEINKAEAFEAASRKLESYGDDREFIPRILSDINSDKAIPILCKQAIVERETLCFWEIARNLRFSNNRSLINDELQQMLESPLPEVRKAGARLCGWQDYQFQTAKLLDLANRDSHNAVRVAAVSAIKRQKNEAFAVELYESMASSDDDHLWVLLDAITNLVDPSILINKGSSLWIWPILENKSYSYKQFVDKRLSKRRKEIEKEAKILDEENR